MHNICRECGLAANAATCIARYGNHPKERSFKTSTYSEGICEYCGRKTAVTEERDFFYPNTKLINWKEFRKELDGRRSPK